MSVAIIGVSTTKFGELWGTSPRVLAREAVYGAMKDADIAPKEIQALFVGNMLSGILGGQEHLGALFSEELGLHVPAFKIEAACASGGLALHSAVVSVLSGLYKTVVVLGIEKMTDHKPEDVAAALMAAGSQEERSSGATFPGLYALLARAHMKAFGTTIQNLAAVAVKNHFHASLNPNAQFHNAITKEQVLTSSKIADPLRLLDCSPVSDGASALILSTKHQALSAKRKIQIIASAVATDTLGLAQRESLLELNATKKSSKEAYRQAGVSPGDIDVAEVHDCFTIAEILAIEDLGFAKKGEAAAKLERGEYSLNKAKKLVVNPSGGLKGCGHPVGATGVKQVVEVVDQLRMRAGKRQVAGAKIGLTHNVGGSGATAVVHILKANKTN